MKFVIMQQVYMSFVFAPPLDRIRPVIRYVLASFSGIASIIPQDGQLLDVGCGDGLLALYLRKIKKRTQPIVGIDVDERKIRVAEHLDLSDTKFHLKDVKEMSSNSFEIVTVVHVLYLISLNMREEFLQHCIRVLKPGGSLILVINTDKPKWKYYITFLQELLMVKLLGHTKGETIRFESLDECRTWIARAGAVISTVKRLDRGRPYSHAVVLAHKRLSPEHFHLDRLNTVEPVPSV